MKQSPYHLQMIKNICQLHIDVVAAYDQALIFIDDNKIYNQIANFQHAHIQHIERLNHTIQESGATPLPKRLDLKGYLVESLTIVCSLTGLRNALKSIEFVELKLTNIYDDCLHRNIQLPEDIKNLLASNYINQMEHLIYIQKILDTPFAA